MVRTRSLVGAKNFLAEVMKREQKKMEKAFSDKNIDNKTWIKGLNLLVEQKKR